MHKVILEIKDIKKAFTKGNELIKVLDGINLNIHEKETIGIIGPSGSGKTTLLQIIGMLDKLNSGAISIDGIDASTLSDKAASKLRNNYFGFIYQFHHLIGEFTALENTMMPLLVRETKMSEAKNKAASILSAIGLSNRLNHRPSELSGGECQRVAVARAMIGKPNVILADEPTGNLDPETAKSVFDCLLELNENSGSGLIVVTHNQELVKKLDRIIELRLGKLVNI
ncbi:MAG: ABC transporter ATP-binding protein [Gammaproteobacteria bacterium]|nr:ABC transporter ATP-binding protein [Gammaproteobacteria bacterium]